jgi:hypothetical protein
VEVGNITKDVPGRFANHCRSLSCTGKTANPPASQFTSIVNRRPSPKPRNYPGCIAAFRSRPKFFPAGTQS